MNIGRRLAAGIALLLGLPALVLAIALWRLGDASRMAERIVDRHYPPTVQANWLIDRSNETARAMAEALLSEDAGQRQQRLDAMQRARAAADTLLAELRSHGDAARHASPLENVATAREAYLTAQQRFVELVDSAAIAEARQFYLGEVVQLQDRYVDAIDALIRSYGETMQAEVEAGHRFSRDTQGLVAWLALGCIAIAVATGIALTRSITRPLATALGIAREVSAGRLDIAEVGKGHDETAQLIRALAGMAAALARDRAALHESERRYRLLAEQSSDVICRLSAECRFIYLSPACERLFGRSAESLLGETPHALMTGDPAQAPDQDEPCPLCAAGGCVFTLTFQHRRADGATLWIETVGRRVTDGSTGATREIVAVMRDVTARHLAEQRLRDSQDMLARSQQQAQLGSWRFDIDSGRLTWSTELFRLFALPTSEVPTFARFLQLVHPDDRAAVELGWQQALQGATYDLEHRIRIGGRIEWVRERAEIERDADGRPLCAIGTAQLITALKHNESELLSSRQQLRDLAAYLERLREDERAHLAREVHDQLGQYLTALRLDAGMLALRFGPGTPELLAPIESMKQTIDQTMSLVRDITARLRPGVLDEGLDVAVEWLLSDFSRRSGIRSQLYRQGLDRPLDDAVATAAFRILQESLTNVSRHAQASQVEVRVIVRAGALELSVADDGAGFDPDQLAPPDHFGLLGMHERALMFGGRLTVDSQPGRGTRIIAQLPLPEPASP